MAEGDRELLRRLAQRLVGPAEIAALLNVAANTINAWKARHSDFPTPVRRLKMGDVWDSEDIVHWADESGRHVVREAKENFEPDDDR